MSETSPDNSSSPDFALLEARAADLRAQLYQKEEELKTRVEAMVIATAEIKKLRDALDSTFEQSTRFCYQLLNAFDPLLGDQARAVVDICARMAKSRYFPPEEKASFLSAAWLHDLGLINYPRSLLHRMHSDPASLSDDEQKAFRHHPARGQQLVFFADNMRRVGEIIRAHHERFDGHGYPDGFAGETIPWPARCLAIAVFFVDCNLPKEQALETIQNQAGSAFDPEAVRLFFQMTQAGSLPLRVREVMADDLAPGMRLANAISNTAGLLLFPEGMELTEAVIAKIRNHNMLCSVTQRFLVFS